MNVLLDSPNFHEEWAKERFSRFLDETTKVTIFPFAFHEDWVRDKKRNGMIATIKIKESFIRS